jgi:hypothetical protein
MASERVVEENSHSAYTPGATRPYGSEFVCRAVTRSEWIEDGVLQTGVFALDPGQTCLSVNYEPGCGKEYLNSYLSCYGAVYILIDDLESNDLAVTPDPLEDRPYHAIIEGLPPFSADREQLRRIERIASLLVAKACLDTWPRVKRPRVRA